MRFATKYEAFKFGRDRDLTVMSAKRFADAAILFQDRVAKRYTENEWNHLARVCL